MDRDILELAALGILGIGALTALFLGRIEIATGAFGIIGGYIAKEKTLLMNMVAEPAAEEDIPEE